MRVSCALLLASCALVLSGCSAMPAFDSNQSESGSIPGSAFKGMVHGGQNPISGAHVYLYAVNNTGYAGPGIAASSGNASVSLLTSATGNPADGNGHFYVTTDSNGNFSVTGDYTCLTATPYVYVLAVGGNSGSGANSAITLAAGLGPCTASGFSSLFADVNEVSTVAAAYAGAGFATDVTHASSSSTALAATGVKNAYAAIVNLETLSTGVANATPLGTNGTVPQKEINTLANILAACVNSTGPAFSPCTTLFSNAKNGSATPADTGTAMLNIAHNPGANISNLFGLQTASSPFQPDLSAAPNDFTIAISFSGGGLNGPDGIAIDSSGNVWVANVNSSPGEISKFDPVGVALTTSSGYTGGGLSTPAGLAIDGAGNVWVANENNSISKFNSSGTAISTSSGYTSAGLTGDAINDLVIDSSGNVWLANDDISTNVIVKFNSSGSPLSGSGYSGGGLDEPTGVAIDISGNVWVGDNPQQQTGSGISEFNSSGTANASSPFTGGGLNQPEGLAFDASGNLWVANYLDTGSISEFNASGAANGSSPFTGGGLDLPVGLAIDGAGNIWAANNGSTSISVFNSSGTPISGSSGYQGGGLDSPAILAIDLSGNVWVSNPGPDDDGTTIVEFVGAASPVVTPVVANLLTPYGAHAVNKP